MKKKDNNKVIGDSSSTKKTKNSLKELNNKNYKLLKKDKKINSEKKSFFAFLKRNNSNSEAVKKYKKNRNKKKRQKRFVNGKFSLDVFDLLIVVVLTAIVSCLLTGVILNYQYKKNFNFVDTSVISDKKVKEFLETYSEIVNNFYEEVDKNAMIEAALEGMLIFLEDNYSIYLDKTETDSLSESLDGSYQGIGIVAMGNMVYQVYEGSPAEKAGIKAEDEIININGTEVSNENYEQIAELLDKKKENVVVVKRDNKKLTFNIKVSEVEIPSVDSDIIVSKDKKNKIGYLKLVSFSAHSFEDFQDELMDLEKDKIDSLIIDLRDNTGGYLNSATEIASLFLEKGKEDN